MIKIMFLLKKKAGLSDADFRQRYEAEHAPLTKKLFPQLLGYKRSYVRLEGGKLFQGEGPLPFDAIAEIHFQDRASLDAALAVLAERGPVLEMDLRDGVERERP